MFYSVDIGTWEHGTVVRFSANSDESAIDKSFKIAKDKGKDVVQIRRLDQREDMCGRIFFDFMNGHMK